MFANQRISEWVYAGGQSPDISTGRTQIKINGKDGLSLKVAQKFRFRRIYLAAWFRGNPEQNELRLTLRYLKGSAQIREDIFGVVGNVGGLLPSGIAQLHQDPPPLPPFSFSRIAWGSLPENPPSTQSGDQGGQIVISNPDVNENATDYLRLTPWVTVEECDELQLQCVSYATSSTTLAANVCLWLGCHSSAIDY